MTDCVKHDQKYILAYPSNLLDILTTWQQLLRHSEYQRRSNNRKLGHKCGIYFRSIILIIFHLRNNKNDMLFEGRVGLVGNKEY